MKANLYENKPHGTQEYPYVQYHLCQVPHPFQIPVHWHTQIEIIYIQSGSLELTISGENYIGTSGSIFVVNTGELHFMENKKGDANYYAFLFPLELISFQTDDYLENHYLLPLRSGKLQILPQIPPEHTPQVGRICEALTQAQSPEKKDLLSVRIELLRLFAYLIDHRLFTVSLTQTSSIDKEIITYIQQNYKNHLTLADLSREFHLSEKYLSRYFSEHFQLSFSHYIRHLRLSNAKTLLLSTDLPITEIALQCGFSNVSYFIRAFKDTYKSSPLKYRSSTASSALSVAETQYASRILT